MWLLKMKYLNRIRPFYFFFAFVLGIVYIYLIDPSPKYVTKHPTPENAGNIIYKENKGCFIYKLVMLDCPNDKSGINNQPITVED